jgi:hypothetical protein
MFLGHGGDPKISRTQAPFLGSQSLHPTGSWTESALQRNFGWWKQRQWINPIVLYVLAVIGLLAIYEKQAVIQWAASRVHQATSLKWERVLSMHSRSRFEKGHFRQT